MTKIKKAIKWIGTIPDRVLASFLIGLAIGLISEWISMVYFMGWDNYITTFKEVMSKMYGF